MKTTWNANEAHDLCVLIEAIAPKFGCHVALTGGVLYAGGERKDVDILFYRIRQVKEIDVDGLFEALSAIGLRRETDTAVWCIKAKYLPTGSDAIKKVDCFFPDLGGEYLKPDEPIATVF